MSVRAMSATPDGAQRQRPQRLDSLKNPIARPLPGAKRLTVAEQAKRTAKACTNPDCQSADVGEEDGNVICRQCGTVLSESLIVTDEVQFVENSAGGMTATGQRVLADQAHTFGGLAGLRSYNPESRSAAETNGKYSSYSCVHERRLSSCREAVHTADWNGPNHLPEPFGLWTQCLQACSWHELHPRP